MGSLCDVPLSDAVRSVLDGQPSWVIADVSQEPPTDELRSGDWDIDMLLVAAWASGDAELVELADLCEELGTHHLMT